MLSAGSYEKEKVYEKVRCQFIYLYVYIVTDNCGKTLK